MPYDSASGPLHDGGQYMQGLWQPDGAFAALIRIGFCIGCSCHVRVRLAMAPVAPHSGIGPGVLPVSSLHMSDPHVAVTAKIEAEWRLQFVYTLARAFAHVTR